MIVNNFINTCADYENFMIWDVENMKAFFEGNGVIAEIFKEEYKMTVEEFESRRGEISDTNLVLMGKLLDQVGDKHFVVFTMGDSSHMDLIQMQAQNVMSFGMDIKDIQADHVYILIMDKKAK